MFRVDSVKDTRKRYYLIWYYTHKMKAGRGRMGTLWLTRYEYRYTEYHASRMIPVEWTRQSCILWSTVITISMAIDISNSDNSFNYIYTANHSA